MCAQKEVPFDMPCDENFIVQCVAVPPGTAPEIITSKMVGNYVEECELSAAYVDFESEEEPSEDDTAVSSESSDDEMTDYEMTSNMELLELGPRRNNSGSGLSIYSWLIAVVGIVLGVLLGYYVRASPMQKLDFGTHLHAT